MVDPDYTGEVSNGYFTYTSTTYGVWVVLRGFLVGGKPDQAVANETSAFPLRHTTPPNPEIATPKT